MAEHGEWNQKGATLSDVTAGKEFGVSREYIAKRLGSAHLTSEKTKAELRKINREIASLKKQLTTLQARKAEIENARTGK